MRNSGVGFARFFMIEVARILGVGCVPNFLKTQLQRSESRGPPLSRRGEDPFGIEMLVQPKDLGNTHTGTEMAGPDNQ